MIKLHFEKISRYERKGEFVEGALPFAAGALESADKLLIHDGNLKIKPQTSVTAVWPDGSVKWVHFSFLADLPANAAKDYRVSTGGGEPDVSFMAIAVDEKKRSIDSGALKAVLAPKGASRVFDSLDGASFFDGSEIEGPVILSSGIEYTVTLENEWRFLEKGPYRVTAENSGRHYDTEGKSFFDFNIRLTFTQGHPWFGLEYRFSNSEAPDTSFIEALFIRVKESCPEADVTLGVSNYKTRFNRAKAAEGREFTIDADYLLYDANEHIPETFYGTFFADWRKNGKGICSTIFQAQQNFPKALRAGSEGLLISLYPEGQKPLEIIRGIEKTHLVYFHLHSGSEDINRLNIRSLQMQFPDRPLPETSAFKNPGVLENIFLDSAAPKIETYLRAKADSCGRAYGIFSWGDAVEAGYTDQGRGKGRPVWTNQEYDYTHANMLMFARTGERRFLDKLLVSARHWMDVDICHHSPDPLRLEAQIEHSAGHASGNVAPSHEWVEGLLDYYHLTGDRRARDSALGIGRNILRILETPQFQQKGEINARETGWALRSLTALYLETGDSPWLEKCGWIVNHFVEWKNEFGAWLSPYTDHSAIRVPFMISVAAASLMRYYRVSPGPVIKELIISAMDDLLENARLPDGLFYYKELPSLRNVSINSIVLEALAYAYELSGEKKYLEAGLPNLRAMMNAPVPDDRKKIIADDAVIMMGSGTKIFAQSHVTTAVYVKALETAGMLDSIR